MTVRPWMAVGLLAFLLWDPLSAEAADCVFIPGKSICGVALPATRSSVVKTMGPPDATMPMGPHRSGLVYGQRMLLIFNLEKLVEVHAWETNPNIDFWHYLANESGRADLRLVFKTWSPWGLSRGELAQHDTELPIDDTDAAMEDRLVEGAEVDIYYDPCYSVRSIPKCGSPDFESAEVNHIIVQFKPGRSPDRP